MSYISDHVKQWRRSTKDRMVHAMGGSCVVCGYHRCIEALDFHHLDPTKKDYDLGKMRASPMAWSRIVVELKKCVMVCSRCHKEIHAGITEVPEGAAMFDPAFEDYRQIFKSTMTPCPVCGELKRPTARYCSLRCAATSRRKIEWERYDLIELTKTMNNSAIGRLVGVSDVSVAKRLRKLARGEGLEPPVGFLPTD
jgi:hypothetical protein